jgi:hypothetical protein
MTLRTLSTLSRSLLHACAEFTPNSLQPMYQDFLYVHPPPPPDEIEEQIYILNEDTVLCPKMLKWW